MNKKYLILLVLSALTVFTVMASYYFFRASKPLENLPAAQPPKVALKSSEYLGYAGNSSCDGLASEQERQKCTGSLLKNINNQKPDGCDDLPNIDDRKFCLKNQFIKAAVLQGEAGKCKDLTNSDDAASCADQVALSLAIRNRDAKACAMIVDKDEQKSCVAEVESIISKITVDLDTDHDGLSDELEKKYGTNPKAVDTDGDGHTDGEEVRGGFNPKGAGKLKK